MSRPGRAPGPARLHAVYLAAFRETALLATATLPAASVDVDCARAASAWRASRLGILIVRVRRSPALSAYLAEPSTARTFTPPILIGLAVTSVRVPVRLSLPGAATARRAFPRLTVARPGSTARGL